MSDKDKLRNELSMIEDEARSLRNDVDSGNNWQLHQALHLISELTQVIREDIVK